MIRTKNGRRALNLAGKLAFEEGRVRTTWKTPEKIVPQQIRFHLCKDGPKKCAECRMCAFGRYYVDNHLGEQNEAQDDNKNALVIA